VVIKHAGTEVHEAVQYLIRGFDSLREKEDIRKRAELLRYITNMDVSMVRAYPMLNDRGIFTGLIVIGAELLHHNVESVENVELQQVRKLCPGLIA
jgi:hypothetical protein